MYYKGYPDINILALRIYKYAMQNRSSLTMRQFNECKKRMKDFLSEICNGDKVFYDIKCIAKDKINALSGEDFVCTMDRDEAGKLAKAAGFLGLSFNEESARKTFEDEIELSLRTIYNFESKGKDISKEIIDKAFSYIGTHFANLTSRSQAVALACINVADNYPGVVDDNQWQALVTRQDVLSAFNELEQLGLVLSNNEGSVPFRLSKSIIALSASATRINRIPPNALDELFSFLEDYYPKSVDVVLTHFNVNSLSAIPEDKRNQWLKILNFDALERVSDTNGVKHSVSERKELKERLNMLLKPILDSLKGI